MDTMEIAKKIRESIKCEFDDIQLACHIDKIIYDAKNEILTQMNSEIDRWKIIATMAWDEHHAELKKIRMLQEEIENIKLNKLVTP